MSTIREQLQTVLHARDGEDHVNVSAGGRTNVGRMCAANWSRQFYIPHLGEFSSIRAFAQWMASGEDEYRQSPHQGRVQGISSNDYHTLLLFAKYFQMTSFANTIRNEPQLVLRPWVSYKQFDSGVRQHDVWTEYPLIVREYADFIIHNQNPKDIFPWAELYPDVLLIVNKFLRNIVEGQGGEFIPFEELITRPAAESRGGKPRRPRVERPRKNSFANAGQHTFVSAEQPAAESTPPADVAAEDQPSGFTSELITELDRVGGELVNELVPAEQTAEPVQTVTE